MSARHITTTLLLFICGTSYSQGLHKEITVEQEIVPAKRDAARISVLPTVTLPPVRQTNLTYSDRVVTARVPNAITTLDPVAWGDRLYSSEYRGYIDLGVGFPVISGNASAGYRMLDTDRTRLSLWGQYDGDLYKRGHYDFLIGGSGDRGGDSYTWRDHTASLGADLHQAIGNVSTLDAGLNYTYGYHNLPGWYRPFSQVANTVNASALFNSHWQGLTYRIGLDYQHFGFGNASFKDGRIDESQKKYRPVKQNLVKVNLMGKIAAGEHSSAGLEANIGILGTSRHNTPLMPYWDYPDTQTASETSGTVTLTPFWALHGSSATIRIGADVDFSINAGKVLHFAPDVLLAWHRSPIFGIEFRAHGGSRLNQLASLYDITPYINASMAYGQSHIPYALDAKMTFGPFLGATVEVFGGYAKANDWLMPVEFINTPGAGVFSNLDIKGYHLGAAIGYDNGRTLSARVSWETAPSKHNRAYYEWRDRARHVIDAKLKLRPVDKVLVTVGYELRTGRSLYRHSYSTEQIGGLTYYPAERESLGTVSNLTIGAGLSVTDQLSIYARAENILNRDFMLIGGRPARGIHALVGVGFKF